MTLQQQIADDISRRLGPISFTRYAWHETPAREWQLEVLRYISGHLRDPAKRFTPCQIAVSSGHGIGKALRPDDEVPTPRGFRRVADIRPGDELFGEHGEPVEVYGVKLWPDCPFYEVRLSDGTTVDVSSGHMWKVKDRQARRKGTGWKILSTEEIVRAGVLRPNGVAMARHWEIPRAEAVAYPYALLPVDPYTYGVWLGDGDKRSGRITNIDPEVWENVAYPFKGVGKTRTLLGLRVHLRKAGLSGCTTYNAIVDRRYMECAQRLEVLQGLLDTDGWVEECGSAAFASASRELTKSVVELARSLGLRAREETFKPNEHAGSWQTHITWDGKTQLFRIVRKQKRLVAAERRYTANWIESITPKAAGQGVCFEVEGSLFLTKQFIVTHNSALISMLIWWGVSTCEDTRIIVTANTESQLRTKTWPEVTKWAAKAINAGWFEVTATSLYSVDKGHERIWRADAITNSEKNTEAFAGLHNKGKRIIVIYDEASAIPDKIWEVTEGALTDEDTEIIWLAFGNPTQNTGRFRECFGKFKHRWKTFQIDSRTVEGTNKAQIAKWEADWGEDSDFFRVRVRGEFPRSGSGQFIASDAVAACRKYVAESYESLAKIISVDVARYGEDETIILCRQGRKVRILDRGRGWDTVQTAERTIAYIQAETPDATVIDGDGIGGGVVDQMKSRGYATFEFHGGAAAYDPNKYFNRRAEVWGLMRDAVNAGIEIPDSPDMEDDLTGPQYYFSNKGAIQLEKKDDMKARGQASPNTGDALAMSYSVDVLPRAKDDDEDEFSGRLYGKGWMG